MAISTRRRRRKLRAITLAALLLLAALAVLFFFLQKREKPAEAAASPASPPPAEAIAPAPSPAPQTPAATPEPPPLAAPQAPATPAHTLPPNPSALERSLYQGSLSIEGAGAAGSLSLTYVNKGVDTLYALYFHLYPNTQAAGSLSIEAATLNGVRAYYILEQEGALLCLPLVNELRSGEEARVFLRFKLLVPKYGFGRARAESDALPLLCAFPTAAVYENGWVLSTEPDQPDFAPLADWRLLIQAPRLPALAGGETQELGPGRYLCAAQAYAPELYLE